MIGIEFKRHHTQFYSIVFFEIPWAPYQINQLSPFTFLWRAKKSNKRNPPSAADSPLKRMVSVARAKTR